MRIRIATAREWKKVARWRERDIRNVMLVAIWNAAQPSRSAGAALGENAREAEAVRLVREVVRRGRAVASKAEAYT